MYQLCLWAILLKLGHGPCKTWTLQNLDPEKPWPCRTWILEKQDPEKPGPWKTWETAGCRKKIRRPLNIILLTLEIYGEETFNQVLWKSTYCQGFFRVQVFRVGVQILVWVQVFQGLSPRLGPRFSKQPCLCSKSVYIFFFYYCRHQFLSRFHVLHIRKHLSLYVD